jgi:cyclase
MNRMTKNICGAVAKVVGLLSIFLVWAGSTSAQSADFSLHRIGDDVWAAIVTDAGKAGGNAGFVVGDEGIAVIDTFEDPGAARELLAAIRKISTLPIRFVINTHYHLDHVNGNDVFANAGAMVVAHRNVRAWMRTENLKWWGDAIKPADKARVQSLKLPDIIYDDRIDLYLGNRLLEVRFLPGHTGGDSVVHVPDAQVVFCGDLLWKDHVPNLMDASTDKWVDTLDSLRKDYAQFVFVPGHGGVANSGDITIFQGYLVGLRGAVRGAQRDGKSGGALVDAILPGLKQQYGAWGFFDDFAKDNIVQTAQELAGRKQVPQPAKAEGRR